jgi:hypothetical protein
LILPWKVKSFKNRYRNRRAYHNPYKVSYNKYYDDLTKQNSLIYQNWKVYRWVYRQLKNQPEKVKDELRTFVGEIPIFKMLDDYLPRPVNMLLPNNNLNLTGT